MTDVTIYSIVAVIAALLAMVAGRVFALEGGKHVSSILAAGYVGAGVGLMSSVLIGPLLALIAQYVNSSSTTWFDALDVAGTTLLWGTLAGVGGGLAVGTVVMALPSSWFR
jgi:1,4-dihydroxy-2-naphthoate octaprenyltransferase